MRRGWGLLLACVLSVGLIVGLATGASAAVAQSDESGFSDHQGESPTETPHESGSNESNASSGGDEPRDVLRQVDPTLVIEDAEYNDSAGTMTLTFRNVAESGSGSSVSITEAPPRSEVQDLKRIGMKVVDVPQGERVEVTVELFSRNPLGVMITSSVSSQKGHATFIAAETEAPGLFRGQASWGYVRAAAFGAAGASPLVLLLVSWTLVARKNEDEQDAEIEPKTTFWGAFKDR